MPYPALPTAVKWDSAILHEETPHADYKRKFRYSKLSELPNFDYVSPRLIEDEEARYYFYRA